MSAAHIDRGMAYVRGQRICAEIELQARPLLVSEGVIRGLPIFRAYGLLDQLCFCDRAIEPAAERVQLVEAAAALVVAIERLDRSTGR